MRRPIAAACSVLLSAPPLAAQAPPAPAASGASIKSVEAAAVAALNFTEGEAASVTRAKASFTPDGWKEFMKWMDGFLDGHGAPAFSSRFAPSGPAAVLNAPGDIHLTIPGTLTQSTGASRTTYSHAAIDVRATGIPARITHLEVIYSLRRAQPAADRFFASATGPGARVTIVRAGRLRNSPQPARGSPHPRAARERSVGAAGWR